MVLLFTDGQSNRNSAQTKERAKELRATGAEVFTVSLDKEIDLEELYSIATSFQHVIQVIIHLPMPVCIAYTKCFGIKYHRRQLEISTLPPVKIFLGVLFVIVC